MLKYQYLTKLVPSSSRYCDIGPRPRDYKTFLCSTQLSITLIMLKNVKIVGILTIISMINETSESLKARQLFIYKHFSFYEQLKFRAQLS